jgi:hypothetical protein
LRQSLPNGKNHQLLFWFIFLYFHFSFWNLIIKHWISAERERRERK